MAGSYASELATLTFGDDLQVAVAVHGITASAMAWSVAARAMPREWTLVAPDLRGRGASADLPGPYGLDRHTDDICTLASNNDDERVPDPLILTPPAGQSGDLQGTTKLECHSNGSLDGAGRRADPAGKVVV
jgi:pimeloyl-ACP methyl ester carboxylesterase